MVYDAARRQLVVFGGNDGSDVSDIWLGRFELERQRDEACFLAVDNDIDGQAGCVDPDCWGHCTLCGDLVCQPDEDALTCVSDCS
jgi:hypothetical protein